MSEDLNELATYWSVFRFKGKTDKGAVYPIRLQWSKPVSRAFVLNYCKFPPMDAGKDFLGFKHFTCHPF